MRVWSLQRHLIDDSGTTIAYINQLQRRLSTVKRQIIRLGVVITELAKQDVIAVNCYVSSSALTQ